MSDLQRAWDAAHAGAERRSWVVGRLGRLNADASYTILSGRKDHVYVALGQNGELGVTTAYNPPGAGVPLTGNLPVRMKKEQGRYVIYGVDVNNPALK